MSSSPYASEADLINAICTGDPGAFTYLYDQYAPVLLGVIKKIVDDEHRAGLVLTKTFITARLEIDKRPVSQPLFLWLFNIARQTAAESLATAPKTSPYVVQLLSSGRIATGTSRATSGQTATSTQQRLLNAVLFECCTPQEASRAAGLPAEDARQHLRQALLQLRGHGI